MRQWALLGEAAIPGSHRTLKLYRGKDDFSITISGGDELMNTRKHGSEDALGKIPCDLISSRENSSVLVGGLGMGFTLAACLKSLPDSARVTVAELIPDVVEWNRGELGDFSGRPLDDPRTHVIVDDVLRVIRRNPGQYDVIALDVDNGPEGLTSRTNDDLYTMRGIAAAQNALKPDGILAYWSAGPDRHFHDCLRQSGFHVDERTVFAHGKKGARHTLWICS